MTLLSICCSLGRVILTGHKIQTPASVSQISILFLWRHTYTPDANHIRHVPNKHFISYPCPLVSPPIVLWSTKLSGNCLISLFTLMGSNTCRRRMRNRPRQEIRVYRICKHTSDTVVDVDGASSCYLTSFWVVQFTGIGENHINKQVWECEVVEYEIWQQSGCTTAGTPLFQTSQSEKIKLIASMTAAIPDTPIMMHHVYHVLPFSSSSSIRHILATHCKTAKQKCTPPLRLGNVLRLSKDSLC